MTEVAFSLSKSEMRKAAPPSRVAAMKYAVADYDKAADYARDIGQLWREAQKAFLVIGRNLVRAKERLPHGDFESMVASELPFGKATAYQLRCIADAVDGGRVLESELPGSSATAYQLACLPQEDLDQARASGLVRCDVKRSELQAWKRARVPKDAAPEVVVVTEREGLMARLRVLDEERSVLMQRLMEMNKRI